MSSATISIQAAASTISITAFPGFAINSTIPSVSVLTPTAQATQDINISTDLSQSISVTMTPFTFGGLTAQPDINLNVGTQQDPVSVNQSFQNFKYKFINFAQDTSSLNAGDVVYFHATVDSSNYGVEIRKVNVSNVQNGAKHSLFIFLTKTAQNTLVLLQKGFYDFSQTSNQIGTWIAGETLYLNSVGVFDTTNFGDGQWIKSVGYCVPNTDNVKRIWFEADTTFVKLK